MANLFGTGINQVPTNGMLGSLAFQDKAYVAVDAIGIGTTFVDSGTASQPLQVAGGGYFSGSVGIGTTNPSSQLHITGQFQSTQANSATTGGGQIYLNGTTGNRIDFNNNGVAAPAFTTRSAGTKIVLNSAVSGTAVDYGFGIESSTLWYSIPDTLSTRQHRWYGGTTQLADLKGTGEFLLGSSTLTGTASQRLQVTGGAYVSGSVGIGTTNPGYKLSVYGNLTKTSADGSPFVISSNDATNPFQFIISRSSSSVTRPYWAIESVEQSVAYRNLSLLPAGGNVTIGSTLDTGTASQKLQVDGGAYVSGNVGIGTTNPSGKLEVTGGFTYLESIWAKGQSSIYLNDGNWTLGWSSTGLLIQVAGAGGGEDVKINSNKFVFSAYGQGEKFRIANNGAIGLSGENYGTAGQVLTSNGSAAAPTWQSSGGGVDAIEVMLFG